MNKYDNIINLPHYELKNHKRMSPISRAAQFSPFAALTGFEDEISETGRIVEKEKELAEDKKEKLNQQLQILEKEKNLLKITYFCKDEKKLGGKYIEYTGILKQIDKINNLLIFTDKTKIPLEDILDIIIDNS